ERSGFTKQTKLRRTCAEQREARIARSAPLLSWRKDRRSALGSGSIKSVWRRLVERPPEIPRGHRTIRAPFLAKPGKLFRRRQFSPAECFGKSLAHAVIVHWPDIGPAQVEKQ